MYHQTVCVSESERRWRACYDLRFKLNVRLGCGVPRPWPCANVGFGGTLLVTVLRVVKPRALGFKGDSALDGGRAGIASVFNALFPVALRLTGGRPVPFKAPDPPDLSVVVELTPRRGTNSSVFDVPSACRRAFSCLFWTVRKCDRSSFHLISSRPIFERVVDTFDIVLLQRQRKEVAVAIDERTVSAQCGGSRQS